MFETIGYFEEFFVNGKYVGTKKTNKQKRDFGYQGRKVSIATETIILDNKRKIVAGQEYITSYYPLNGRVK